jgi:hypothetical protein
LVRPYQSMDYVIQLRNMVSLGLWSEMMDDIVNDDMNFLDLKIKFVLLFIPNFVFWFLSQVLLTLQFNRTKIGGINIPFPYPPMT